MNMPDFKLVSDYKPMGDQITAIESLTKGIQNGDKGQTLLGVTGSGKTFTIANVIKNVNKPTLVLAHNKILAAQLCSEFKEFFPENAVEYFVSYYDYYQPEAYIAHTDTYIEKDASINEEIDRLRLAATASLLERRDVIVVSSVSCIYGLGEPDDFQKMMINLTTGAELPREELMRRRSGSTDRDALFVAAREAELLDTWQQTLALEKTPRGQAFDRLKTLFGGEVEARAQAADRADEGLTNAFAFLDAAIPDSQELVLFATELTANWFTSWFIQNFGCDAYFAHNKKLLFDDTRAQLLQDIDAAKQEKDN